MALKFSQLKRTSTSRIVDSIDNVNLAYSGRDGQQDLVVPAKLVTLESGAKGYITNERYPELESQFTADADDNIVMPDSWKVGSPKNGLDFGFWYNAETLTPSQRTAKVIPL